eukprot:914193-Rhodomonas_salina.2
MGRDSRGQRGVCTALLGSAEMELTPAMSAKAFWLNTASASSTKTTSSCTVAVAELKPERSLRRLWRGTQSSSPRSTVRR